MEKNIITLCAIRLIRFSRSKGTSFNAKRTCAADMVFPLNGQISSIVYYDIQFISSYSRILHGIIGVFVSQLPLYRCDITHFLNNVSPPMACLALWGIFPITPAFSHRRFQISFKALACRRPSPWVVVSPPVLHILPHQRNLLSGKFVKDCILFALAYCRLITWAATLS